MHEGNVSRTIAGGFIATIIMTALMYGAPMIGLPRMDIASMLGSLFNGMQPPPTMSSLWWAGMLVHFILGSVVFTLIYAYFVAGWLPGAPSLRGATWGLVLWLLSEIIVMPMMGAGAFSSQTPTPALMVVGSLIGHLVYGAALGALLGHSPEHHVTAHHGHA